MNNKNKYETVSTTDDSNKNEKEVLAPPNKFGVRHSQMLILFLCIGTGYLIRSQLSITIVAMTTFPEECTVSDNVALDEMSNNDTNVDVINEVEFINDTNVDVINEVEFINDTNVDVINEVELINDTKVLVKECVRAVNRTGFWSVYRSYSWGKSTQEMIMFSFFAGYTTMMLPAGLLTQKYGGKKPILGALFINGLISILTPWMAVIGGWLAVCSCRFIQGMSQAAFFPSLHCMLAKWSPISERGRLSSYVYSGTQIGTILAFQVAGFLSGSSLGWPAAFWLCGVLCFFCFGLLFWLGAATPHEHPRITDAELMYITGESNMDIPRSRRVPWLAIFSSRGVWAIVIAQIGSVIAFLFVLTQTPRYLDKILGIGIKKNGFYSSLPFIALYFLVLACGFTSDYLKTKGYMSIVNIRKLFTTIGALVSTMFLVAFVYTSNATLAVVLLVICQGLHSGVFVGFHINHIDISPNFAAAIMSVTNMFGNLGGLLVPVIVSNVVKDDTSNPHKWQLVVLIMAGIVAVTNFVYILMAQGDVQSWNYDEGDVEYHSKRNIELRRNSVHEALQCKT